MSRGRQTLSRLLPSVSFPFPQQSVTFCCTYRLPTFHQEIQSTFCPRPARTTPPHARALLPGGVASFYQPKNPRRYEPEWPITSSPISAQTTTALQLPFWSTAPRNERGKSQRSWGVAGKVQHPQYAPLKCWKSMFYKRLSFGKKVQFFVTKSAIFFNQLFFMFLFFRSCGKKKCNLIALLLHFYCTLRVLNFSFCFIVLSVFFQPCCTCCTFPNTPHDF